MPEQPMKALQKKKRQTAFKRLNNWLHLLLGLVSGAIMFVVCLMACVWVFNEEVMRLLVPDPPLPHVAVKEEPLALPSVVMQQADPACKTGTIRELRYRKGKPVSVIFYSGPESYEPYREEAIVLADPYTGACMGTLPVRTEAETARLEKADHFFHWALDGHRTLWLPWQIGSPVVNYSTLVFVVLLVTGLIWWYPGKWNRTTFDKSFRIKWSAGWKRINVDLHNVPGFYALLVLLVLSLTGMVYGLEWYSNLLYRATNWGVPLKRYPPQQSDSVKAGQAVPFGRIIDESFIKVVNENRDVDNIFVYLPDTARANSALRITAVPTEKNYYRNVFYGFDRYTGGSLPQGDFYGEPFAQSTTGEKIRRMNYDMHVGSVLGLPGKILAFFASLIGASLPVTGFIIWYNRKWGKKGRKKGIGRTVPVRNF